MDTVLGDLYGKGVLCYIDDIVIYGHTLSDTLELLEEVLSRCCEAGLFLKISKSEILKNEVKLLGHRVGLRGVRPCPSKIDGIRRAKAPENKNELRSFLGAASYIRKFVPHFSTIVAPLTALLKKTARFEWGVNEQEAFETLKLEISDRVILTAPSGSGPMVLVTDASDKGIGAVLMQIQKGALVALEFASKTLTPQERKWDTREREAYAIKWSLERFQDYVKGTRTIVVTDHQSLQWMKTCSSGKVQRWALYFQQFDLEIVHLQGKHNMISDWLSRSCPEEEPGADRQVEEMAVPMYVVGAPYVPDLETIKTYQSKIPEADKKLCKYGEDDMLYYARNNRLYVPTELREDFMHWFHASRYGGHCGINRTLRRMNKWIWWPDMRKEVTAYIQRCPICNLKEKKVSRRSGMIGVLDRPYPMQLVSLDFVGPRTWNNAQFYYLVIIDHATRFVVTEVCKEATAAVAKKVFSKRWISIFGVPDVVLTDRGSTFRAAEFTEYVVKELGSYHMYTSPYYPQGNGVNEASHAGLENSLAGVALTPSVVTSFEEALGDATLIHNSTPHVSTGYSPSYMMFGYEARLPGFQEYSPLAGEGNIANVRKSVADGKKARYTEMMKETMQTSAKETFKAGDTIVYLLSEYEKQRYSEMFGCKTSYKPNWSFPHKVVKVVDKVLHCAPLEGTESSKDTFRQVPVTQVRKLKLPVPESLANLDWGKLQYDVPHRPWKRPIPDCGVRNTNWYARNKKQKCAVNPANREEEKKGTSDNEKGQSDSMTA